ncbi:beta-N-acetylhexosaminidase [Streptomyces sp. NBC_00264]|uniref:glycoside hydrolase family 3 N-terminal domain-containing protein n=1 Tax=unclassified Streptomyces TaxID=2593676 RepID=UPI002251769A|nr:MULTISPECIES: glycoside hydrolase family 3 N-terminal domain-containing protein [unclassified Streptomyces]MCX4399131.1 beta-N-acetylhexosaminidase [Streptomyces sp. NBC_01767]MCX5157884.1 beta-N-acetylhexosaminidase [Streptomyces sp. NBC_00305]MCX5216407.1 beta-N-acetylhexosaminidase [Streptomyces sp. NBC_00264]
MTSTPQPLSRRGALLAGTAALAGGMGLAGRSDAAVRIPERARTSLPALKSEQRAGQCVIHSYPGLTPPARLMDAIREGRTAGVIFFGENIESLSQIEGVIQEMNDANASAPVKAPLLLMTDQEGGMVRRLPGEPVLSAKDVGGSTDPEGQAEFTGSGAGMNLAGVGMNVNLAPVLDVYRRAGDFTDQYERSYSKDQDAVGTCGSAFITAQQDAGVAATAKHFPGLGPASANQNTDLGPVTLTTSVSTLRSVDEVPYRAAISAGTKLVMLSWAVYRALDADRPAGLSPTVVGELRNRLGFPGVTVTDALEAGALRAYGSTAERAVLAAAAGMDLILCSARDTAQGEEAVTALSEALAAGTLDGTAFDAGAERVNALRGSLS